MSPSTDRLPGDADSSHPQMGALSAARTITEIALFVIPVVLGLAFAFVSLREVAIPKLGLSQNQRLKELVERLGEGFEDESVLVFVGNSITVEGVDASVVQEQFDKAGTRWRAMHFGINGANLAELGVLAPTIANSGIKAVVFSLRVNDIGLVYDLHPERAISHAWLGTPSNWPGEWGPETFEGITPSTWKRLTAGEFQSTVALRSVPRNYVENELVFRLRSGIRRSRPDDWTAPFDLTRSLSGGKLERHIQEVSQTLADSTDETLAAGVRTLEATVKAYADAGVTPVMVICPVHPGISEQDATLQHVFGDTIARLARENGGFTLDARELLDATEFADAIHPNKDGRDAYSAFVGKALSDQLGSGAED